MIKYVLENDRKMALAHLREGYEQEYFGSPPIFKVFSSARVLIADELEDGRWNIMIEGIERVELKEEIQLLPFRIGKVRPIREEILPHERHQVNLLMHEVAALAEKISENISDGKRHLSNLINIHQHPAIVCDVISSILVTDSYCRQSILEERNILRRMNLLRIQLNTLMAQLREGGIEVD